MVVDLDALCWPGARLGEALEALARQSGFLPKTVETPTPSPELVKADREALGQWLQAAANCLGLEAEPVETPYAEVEKLICSAGPALLHLPSDSEPRFLALLGGRRRAVFLIGPDLTVRQMRLEIVRSSLCRKLEAPLMKEINCLLEEAGVAIQRQVKARAAILRQRLSAARVSGCWLLRLPPSTSFWRLARHAGLPRCLITLVGAHTLQYLLWLLSWWMIGRGVLQGRLDLGWLLAWVLLLLSLIPFRLLVTWLQGVFAIEAGGLLRQRLLYGALRLEPEELRHQGTGQLLGQVIESEAVETLALSGGFLGLVAGLELVATLVILSIGAGGRLHALLLLGWMALAGLMSWRYFQHRRSWTKMRLEMTHDLVERMVGYRTRLAQEVREHWHDGEDQALEHYLTLSRRMDRSAALLIALLPRGWLVLGLLGLAPAFVSGRSSPAAIAIGLGGILLAYRALRKLAVGLSYLVGAALAWNQVALLFQAAARPEVPGALNFLLAPSSQADDSKKGQPILEACDLAFRYRDRHEAVIQECSLQVCAGDRLLLEGPSGGGKSTLASLLIGLRLPDAGLLLLNGLDRQTLGTEGWRHQVAAAPQFHENHVLTETFAFNLLMDRRWPPRLKELEEAELVCRELGLGKLLDQMPAGLLQVVGESGWQLSHGERSRLYIARALLQGADLIVLDESFASLDPETLRQSLHCVLKRAPTLLVIAHP